MPRCIVPVGILTFKAGRLLRQLVSLQDGSGAFCEPDGGKVPPADQALALLAPAKASSVLGADADAALQNAWRCLRGRGQIGSNRL